MARKPLSVYERIDIKRQKIQKLQEDVARESEELEQLYKEKDNFEMQQIFATVKKYNINTDEVISLLTKTGIKKQA